VLGNISLCGKKFASQRQYSEKKTYTGSGLGDVKKAEGWKKEFPLLRLNQARIGKFLAGAGSRKKKKTPEKKSASFDYGG